MTPKVCRTSYRISALILLIFSLLILTGCGPHTIKSNPLTFKPNYAPLPTFEGKRVVGLTNAYLSKQVVDVTVRGPNWVGDLQEYTNSAITLLKEELLQSSISVTGNPEKDMTVRVHDVNLVMGAWLISCKLQLDIKFPDGKTLTFVGENRSPNGYRALDGAILRAVEGVLEDDEFLGFLDIDSGEYSNRL